MTYDPDNLFAKILRKEVSCQSVYEDNQVLAFFDIHPKAPIHVLVIPKEPYISFEDFAARAPKNDIASFFQKVAKIAADLKLSENGFRLVTNNGPYGGQEIFHFHVHLLSGNLSE